MVHDQRRLGFGASEERRKKKTRLAGRREIEHELWLCDDCTIAEVNGDYSGMTEERAEEVSQGIEQLVERVGPLSANFDGETGDGELEFTNRRCDSCGTSAGAGSRHRFASFGKRAREAHAGRRAAEAPRQSAHHALETPRPKAKRSAARRR